MVYSTQNHSVSGLHLSSGILNIRKQRFGNWIREEHRLRVFENRVLRRIFGPKWDEVSREWR
jgi:hypothetical protein